MDSLEANGFSRSAASDSRNTEIHIPLNKSLLTIKTAPHPGAHVFQPTGNIFKLVQDYIETNRLTKFHEDRTVNVASRYWCDDAFERMDIKASIYLRPTMNNQAILEGTTSLTPPRIAFSSILFSTGKCWSH
ncbi:hypothetical protein DPMN_155643 [Dreissena polymorpha]|uniref:Uncharacterized protein n=1 Tax=Dreissena polymorpha TaxID=45954 RepID=A0A9D4JB39_DREPO|nr:hypothetical protein DPMN_155643 [Dreissena polymorpha]